MRTIFSGSFRQIARSTEDLFKHFSIMNQWFSVPLCYTPSVRSDVMSSQPVHYFTVEEYLKLEREASYKSEYLDGEIFAMAGASRRHNLISINAGSSLNAQLAERECEVYVSDMRVRVEATNLLTYPDVVVVCGEPRFHDEDADTLLNPTLIIEVLSKSTSRFDRGEKFEHYRAIESFVEYLLIAQDKFY